MKKSVWDRTMINAKSKKAILGVFTLLALIVGIWFVYFARIAAPDFSQYPAGPERKTAFFSYFEPIVAEVNMAIRADRAQIQDACSSEDSLVSELDGLATKYRVDDGVLEKEPLCDLLLRRADIVPASLALAQGANESAWGTSRFAQEGNNFFGQWCFEEGCGIVPNRRDENKAHEVADFNSPGDSVKSYMLNLNGHDAYKPLRIIRQSLREEDTDITGIQLSRGLNKYSERGSKYGEELREMIRFNKLTQYDDAQ
ncbi:MAG: Bax protein [Paraglaciecola sp.]|jgi:Bax protein